MPKSDQAPAKVRVKLSRILATAGNNYKVGEVIEVSPQQAVALVNDRAATLVDPSPAIERSTSGPDAKPKAGAGVSSRADTVGPTNGDGSPATAGPPPGDKQAGKSL